MLLQKERGVIEDSYYEASVLRPPALPPLAGSVQADVCVVGGGFAGLSAALELAKRGYQVVLLEAQRIGWGASGRNGGQVIVGFGAAGEEAIERQLSPEDARRAWNLSIEGMDLIRQRIAQHHIECDYRKGYLSLVVRASKEGELRRWHDHVRQTHGHPLAWISNREIGQWVASPRFHCAVFDPESGHLHPLRYCLGLAKAAQGQGAVLHEQSPVREITIGPKPLVRTSAGEVRCGSVVLAANVYINEYAKLAPELGARIMPVGTYMLATQPMDAGLADSLIHQRCACSDTNFVLDYFRVSADNRLLFGAGESYSGSTPANLVQRIRRRMRAVFPQLAEVKVEHAWGGFVDITANRAPDFGRLGSHVYYLQGFSGHGVAMAGMAGKLVAEAIAGQAERFDVFARLKHMRFPGGPALRTPALVLGMLYYRLRDML